MELASMKGRGVNGQAYLYWVRVQQNTFNRSIKLVKGWCSNSCITIFLNYAIQYRDQFFLHLNLKEIDKFGFSM
jgi:hypothetical protein